MLSGVQMEQIWDRIAVDTALMLTAADSAGWDAAVPGLDWDVRTVVTHTGAVHRWAADIVGRSLATNETGGSSAFWPPDLTDDRRADWVRAGQSHVLETLSRAPDDLRCFTFLPGVTPHRFWSHRQAHETAVHRIDVEAAAGGQIGALPPDFAQDGLAELVGGFAIEPAFASPRPGRLLLAATDGPSWSIVFGGERTVTTVVDDRWPADAVVHGTSDALYRWAWHRPAPDVIATGDERVLAEWATVSIQ